MLETNKIYNMDFREGINQVAKIDVIITDPPYNINFKYNEYKDSVSEKEYIKMLSEFQNMPIVIIHYPEETIKYIAPALGVPDEVVVWCYNSNLPRQSRLINFYNIKPNFKKVKQPYKNPNDRRIKSLIDNGSKGTRLYDWFSDIQLVKNVSKQKYHPCPVPIELMKRIILLTTDEGGVVCDPFMGSGTTALACLETNRKYIGFEINKEYFDIANQRINNYGENIG